VFPPGEDTPFSSSFEIGFEYLPCSLGEATAGGVSDEKISGGKERFQI